MLVRSQFLTLSLVVTTVPPCSPTCSPTLTDLANLQMELLIVGSGTKVTLGPRDKLNEMNWCSLIAMNVNDVFEYLANALNLLTVTHVPMASPPRDKPL